MTTRMTGPFSHITIGFGLCLLTAAPGFGQGSDKSQQLPDGPGKATLQRVCSGCHAAEFVMGKKRSRQAWEQLVSDMVDKGATGTDDDFNQIVSYLVANFSDGSDKGKPAPKENDPPAAK